MLDEVKCIMMIVFDHDLYSQIMTDLSFGDCICAVICSKIHFIKNLCKMRIDPQHRRIIKLFGTSCDYD